MATKKPVKKETKSKKEEFEDLDDINDEFGDDFDFDKEFAELDGSDREPSKASIAKEAAKATGEGFARSLSSELAKKSLPSEYEVYRYDAMDLVDFTKETFDRSKEKIKKPIQRFARETKKLVPEKLGFINKALDKIIDDQEQEYEYNKEREQENAITSSLASIFDKQIEVQKTLEANREAKEEVTSKVNLQITKKNSEILSSIEAQVTTQTAFTLNIAKDYYKKSLELQFRSYYAQAELLNVTKENFKAFTIQYDKIVKNTGLPDYVKLKGTERLGDIIKTQTTERIYNEFLDKNVYLNNVKKKITNVIDSKLSEITFKIDQATEALSGINQITETGGSKTEVLLQTGGSLAGSAAGERLGGKLADKIKDRVQNNKYVQLGKNILSSFGTSPQTTLNMLGAMAEEAKFKLEGKTGLVNKGAKKALEILAPGFDIFSPDAVPTTFDTENILTSSNPAIFDQHAHRTITSVIPLYLSKILQQNTITAQSVLTKVDDKIRNSILNGAKELHYNFNSGKLESKDSIATSYSLFLKKKTNESRIRTASSNISQVLKSKQINDIDQDDLTEFLSIYTQKNPNEKDLDFTKIFSDNNKTTKELIENNPKFKELFSKLNAKMNEIGKDRKSMWKINEQLNSIVKTGAERDVIELFAGITKLNAIPDAYKKVRLTISDEEATAISNSLIRYVVSSSGAIFIPQENNLKLALGYADMQDDNKKKKLIKKLSVFIQLCKVIMRSEDTLSKTILMNMFSKVNQTINSIAIKMPPNVYQAIYKLNPIIFPDESVNEDGKLKITKAMLTDMSFSEDKTKSIYTDLTTFSSSMAQQLNNYVSDMAKDQGETIIDRLQKTMDSRTEIFQNYLNRARGNAGKAANLVFKSAVDFKKKISAATTPEEVAKVIADATKNIYTATSDKIKETYDSLKDKLNKVPSQLDSLGSKAIDKARPELIKTVDGMIEKLNEQNKDLLQSNEVLKQVASDVSEQIDVKDFVSEEDRSTTTTTNINTTEPKQVILDDITKGVDKEVTLGNAINNKMIDMNNRAISQLQSLKEYIQNYNPENSGAVADLIQKFKDRFTNIKDILDKGIEDFKKDLNK